MSWGFEIRYPRRGPIFHGAAGILPFRLGVELHIPQPRLEARQADHWRLPNQIDDGGGRAGGSGSGD